MAAIPDLGKAVYTLETNAVPLEAGMAKAEAATAKSTKSIGDRLNKGMTQVGAFGKKMTHAITLPVAAGVAGALYLSANFDESLSHIRALVGASGKEMEEYKKHILALAPAVGEGPEALGDALYFITSSGYKGAAAMKILDVSAKGAAAGLGETKTTADLVTSAIKAYGPANLSAKKGVDVLVAAVKAGKGEPAEFAAALQENVSTASALGVSYDELAASTASLSTVNSNVSADATMLSGLMSALIKPGKDATKALKGVGLSVDDVHKEIKQKGFLATLEDLKQKFHGNVTAMARIFPNVRGLRGQLTLTGKAYKDNVKIQKDVTNSQGALAEAYRKATKDNPTLAMKRLVSQLKVMAIVLGDALMPMLTDFIARISEIATWFKNLDPFWQHTILYAIGVAAALGPLISMMVNLYKVGRFVAIGLGIIETEEYAILAPIVLIVAAIALLVVGLVIAYKRVGWFHRFVDAAFHKILDVVHFVVSFIKKYWRGLLIALLGPFGVAIDLIIGYWPQITNAARVAIGWIKRAWSWFDDNLVPPFMSLVHWVSNHIGDLKGPIKAVMSAIGGFLDPVVYAFGKIVGAIQWLLDHSGPIADILGKLGSAKDIIGGFRSKLATGTMSAKGGMTLVGERGPELVNMPRGARVWNNRDTERMIANPGRGAQALAGGGGGLVIGQMRILDWDDGVAHFEGKIVDALDKHDAYQARRARHA